MFETNEQAKQKTIGRAGALSGYVAFLLFALGMFTRELWVRGFARPVFLAISAVILVLSLLWLVRQISVENEAEYRFWRRISALMLLALALQTSSRLNW
jgi:hypothetical protein